MRGFSCLKTFELLQRQDGIPSRRHALNPIPFSRILFASIVDICRRKLNFRKRNRSAIETVPQWGVVRNKMEFRNESCPNDNYGEINCDAKIMSNGAVRWFI